VKIRCTRGFTLIELMISLAIVAILLVLAAPGYVSWVADSQVRNGAESIAAGLRDAMNAAVRENTSVEFVVDPTTATGGWKVQYPAGVAFAQGSFAEGSDRDTFVVTPAGNATVTFTGIGIIPNVNADATAPFEWITVTNPASTMTLRVLVPVNTATGRRSGIKICDTRFAADDPKGCPTATP
jgi:type IV fimbrial biogenesis protein FimT